MTLKTFALTIAYDGTRYAGWQIQPNGLAVQQVVSDAVAKVVGHPVRLMGSGRTDSGVHAVGQVASFSTEAWEPAAYRLAQAINGLLPRDISVLSGRRVVNSFDPIRNAVSKRYRYTLRVSRVPDPIYHRNHWWITKPLDMEAMRAGADQLIGTHDFVSFQTLGSKRKSTTRTLRALDIFEIPALKGKEIIFELEADGFLYNMARNIVGALVAVGRRRFSPQWISETLAAYERSSESQTAPARGLCLLRVDYPKSVFLDESERD
ncbi:MAG: tRNA pseudouridine(38-40) synthase TruA [Pirellula sp.]|jgi:tRNA pseudouridine38-40 synthase|nr:tRNA pseudouridine(38-40) synthase TruA [Pirellula sp.]